MSKGRHAYNPAKTKAAHAYSELQPRRTSPNFSNSLTALMAILSGMLTVALLSVSFAPVNNWPMAYVALVPWTLMLICLQTTRWALMTGWLTGLAFLVINLYWIWWVDVIGYFAMVAFLSLYWLAAAAALRAVIRRGLAAWIALPVIWVAIEFARAYIISGFPWFFLGHSQYQRLGLIQIADVTSDYGVSFFVAMVNGAIIDIIRGPILRRHEGKLQLVRRPVIAVAAVALAAGGLLGYGAHRLSQQTTRPGPVVALIQQAFPNTLVGINATTEKVFHDHAALTASALAGKQCDLVIWPETMLPRGLNAGLLTLNLDALGHQEIRALAEEFYGPDVWSSKFDIENIRQALVSRIHGPGMLRDAKVERPLAEYAGEMAALAKHVGSPILAGVPSVHYAPQASEKRDIFTTRNSTIVFDSDGMSDPYSKMHMVPFGEYLPFKTGWPWLHGFLRSFVPAVMDQLEPGTERKLLVISSSESLTAGQEFKVATPICYEGVFARVCRKLVMNGRQKEVHLLANLSNDGWFVRNNRGSTEQPQHLVQYVFRAIESRVPVVRAVNTGISASIDSDGRIVAEVEQLGFKTMVAGSLVLDHDDASVSPPPGHGPRVLVDSRRSVYSLVGDAFAQVNLLAACALVAWAIWIAMRKRKGISNAGDGSK